MRTTFALLAALPALLLAASGATAQTEFSITLRPTQAALQPGESITVYATVRDGGGTPVPGSGVSWRSTDTEVATVTEDGMVTGVAPGSARIVVIGPDRATAFFQVTVSERPAAGIRASLPADGVVLAGGSAPLGWQVVDGTGAPVEAASGLPAMASSNPGVARVDATGRVFGVSPGEATLEVRWPAREQIFETEVTVRVVEGAAPELTPAVPSVRTGDVVRFSVGPGHFPSWSVSGTGAQIEVEGGLGVFVAERPGRYEVVARIGETSVQATVVEVAQRSYDAELVLEGRGAIASHHSGDMWVFEGVDGRDYVYVGTFLHDWMKVWDVTDPTAPVLTDSLQFDARRINDIKIHPNNRLGIATREGASSRRNGIVILDLADPAHPTILSEYTETVSGGVHNVWIDAENEVVFAAHNGTRQIHILDISDPGNVSEVGRWGLQNQDRTLHDVIVQDGYLYASYWNDGIVMLDVGAGSHGGTPTAPVEVSRFAYPIGNTHVAWRAGRYLFIGDEIFPAGWDPEAAIHARGYIHVVDYSDPENPVEVGRYEVPEAGVHNIWVEGDRMYLGYYQAGLRVVDISGELRGDLYAQGREVARILTTDQDTTVPNWSMTWGAQIHKGRIYSSDLNSGIWITRLVERRPVF
jgi:hypothetical protein